MDSISTEYRITLAHDNTEVFRLKLDERTFDLIADEVRDPPQWTELSFEQCPHCPLSEQQHSHCPLALQLCHIVERFHLTDSIDEVTLEVITEERRVFQTLAIQRAIASILDLVMPVCGCPIAAHMKPLARFHLPLVSEEEAAYRITSTYFLEQYFRSQTSQKGAIGLDCLGRIMEDLHIVSKAVSKRLRGVTQSDSVTNAIALVDVYWLLVSALLDDKLAEMRVFFSSFLPEAGCERGATSLLKEAKEVRSQLVGPSNAKAKDIGDRPAWCNDVSCGIEAEKIEAAKNPTLDDKQRKAIEDIRNNSGLNLTLEPMGDEKDGVFEPPTDEMSSGNPRFYRAVYKTPPDEESVSPDAEPACDDKSFVRHSRATGHSRITRR